MIKKYLIIIVIILIFSKIAISEEDRSIALLIDISLSIKRNNLDLIKNAAIKFVEQCNEKDNLALYTIGNESNKIVDFTKDKSAIINEIGKLSSSAIYSTIYDTIFSATKDLAAYSDKLTAIVIFSDGLDENSTLLFDDVARILSEKKIPVYSLKVGENIVGEKILKRLSLLSSGKYFDLTKEDTNTISKLINEEIELYNEKLLQEKKEKEITKVEGKKEAIAVKETDRKSMEAKEEALPKAKFPIVYLALILILLIFIVISVFGILIYTRGRKEKRKCPKCGRILEEYQLHCPNCQLEEKELKQAEVEAEGEEEKIIIPPELLKRTPAQEEEIENTFVLLEKPVLIIRKGKMIGKKFYLSYENPMTIGRSDNCDIILDDITISSQHCRIIPQENKFIIADLKSTNGTFLNEKKIKQSYLREGDIIRVGETQLLFKIEQER